MKIDRILIDLFDWVRRLVFSRQQGSHTAKPYERLEGWRGNLGVLHRVKRDTPRAVDSYIFSPFRKDHHKIPNPQDIHVCLDHLDILPGQPARPRLPFTHRVTVLIASHWAQPGGTYDTSLLYTADWDFQGNSPYRDRWAIAITHDVARLLKDRPWHTINWAFEFEASAKQMMGASYSRTRR